MELVERPVRRVGGVTGLERCKMATAVLLRVSSQGLCREEVARTYGVDSVY